MPEPKTPRNADKDTGDDPKPAKGAEPAKPPEPSGDAGKDAGGKPAEPADAGKRTTPAPPKGDGGTASRSPATEKPPRAEPPPKTSEYVVTVDNRTGITLKIEKLNAKGERTELTQEEYALIFPYGRPRTEPRAKAVQKAVANALSASVSGGTTPPVSADNAALADAYYRGVADYIKALTGTW